MLVEWPGVLLILSLVFVNPSIIFLLTNLVAWCGLDPNNDQIPLG